MGSIRKAVNLIMSIIFALFVLIPLLNTNLVAEKKSDAENRVLKSFPKIIDTETGKIKTSIIRNEFEPWINDNIGFRDLFVKLNSSISVKIFKTSPNERVRVGKNGWYFYTLDHNIEIANGTFPLTTEDLLQIKEAQETIQQGLAKKGIEYVLVLVPSKTSVYSDEIADILNYVEETPIDIVTNYLREHTTINAINPKGDLIDAKKKGLVYLKTDTHWNSEGAYVAYNSIISRISNYSFFNNKSVNVVKEDATLKGEFSNMMGYVDLLPPEYFLRVKIKTPNTHLYNNKELLAIIEKYQEGHNFVLSSTKFLLNDNIHKGNLLILGDSFFDDTNKRFIIVELLAEHFQKTFFIRSNYISNEVISEIKPDIVIFERTERYIHDLLRIPLQKPSYQIVKHNTPAKIIPGRKYSFNVTVKNTGTENWSDSNNIKFSVLQNGKDVGFKALLPQGKMIKPGDEYTFKLKDLIILEDTDNFEYLMLQEGVNYFGERKVFEMEGTVAKELLPLKNPSFGIVSHDTPTIMIPGNKYSFNVTVKNTGTESWSEANNIKFTIFQNGKDVGFRALLPKGIKIKPGDEYTFNIKDLIILEDTNNFWYSMLQEWVKYFGDIKKFKIDKTIITEL